MDDDKGTYETEKAESWYIERDNGKKQPVEDPPWLAWLVRRRRYYYVKAQATTMTTTSRNINRQDSVFSTCLTVYGM